MYLRTANSLHLQSQRFSATTLLEGWGTRFKLMETCASSGSPQTLGHRLCDSGDLIQISFDFTLQHPALYLFGMFTEPVLCFTYLFAFHLNIVKNFVVLSVKSDASRNSSSSLVFLFPIKNDDFLSLTIHLLCLVLHLHSQ